MKPTIQNINYPSWINKFFRRKSTKGMLHLGEISPYEVKELLEKWCLVHNKPIDWINIPVIGDNE